MIVANLSKLEIMTFEDANKISIKGYLAEQGISPVKEGGYYGMYRCPFRTDNDPSMKVDYANNLWYDHGTSVDLVMKMEQYIACQAITRIESGYRTFDSFSFQGKEDVIPASVEFSIQKVQPLQNKLLLDYICGERKINRDVAKHHLQGFKLSYLRKRKIPSRVSNVKVE